MRGSLRAFVASRAENRCEYCRLPQSSVDATFHIEHIVPRQHDGSDDEGNLALACDRCNLNKGPNLTAIDPLTQSTVPLFNPRTDEWNDHFVARGPDIVGITATGRATVQLLKMNASRRRILRATL